MNKTKEIITNKSLELFNELGVKETTLRKIAIALGISQGNLNYHFKTKQDIIERLYHNLVEELDIEMRNTMVNSSLLKTLYISSGVSLKILYNYRFLLRDIYKILKENDKLKEHYTNLQQIRENQYLSLFKALVSQGVLRVEEFSDEYKRLYYRMNILGDNWINMQELLNNDVKDPVAYYQTLLFEVIYPYLTPKGKKEYKVLMNIA